MAVRVARIVSDNIVCWAAEIVEEIAGVKTARLARIDGDYPTTKAFFEQGGATAAIAGKLGAPIVADTILSPVTNDARFICQATNYADHVREVGGNPDDIVNNIIFTKASSCIAPADTDIICPRHVQLLDYEIELGLVLKRRLAEPQIITAETLGDWIGGLVIVNDISARDVQISHMQFHKSKSYRTFGPVGPWLLLPTGDDLRRLFDLELTLKVDGEVRQKSTARHMIFKPAATLTELSTIIDLDAGDLIATGTPGGVALHPPSAFIQALGGFLSPRKRFAAFLKGQLKKPYYLRSGQHIESTIRTPDGALDLGLQSNLVKAE